MSYNWQIVRVDTTGDVGWYTSLAIDQADHYHVSYYDATNQDLKYAYFDGSSWQINRVDSGGMTGRWTSIAIDAQGQPCISYNSFVGNRRRLRYARKIGANWNIETVDSSTSGGYGQYSSLALLQDSIPCISYLDSVNGDLEFTTKQSGVWQRTTVDAGGRVGWFSSLGIGPNDRYHISYEDGINFNLKYARYNGATWDTFQLDPQGGEYTSLDVDSTNVACIVNRAPPDLKYRRFNGAPQILDRDTRWNAIKLNRRDQPYVAYQYAGMYEALKLTFFDGIAWTKETVDSNQVGNTPSIDFDSQDLPVITYWDNGRRDLKIAIAQPLNLPRVASTTPYSNANGVLDTSRIKVVFDTDMNGATINDTTFLVYGTQRGRITGTITYDAPSKVATFTPNSRFLTGDIVNVILTSRIRSQANFYLASHAFSFTVRAPAGYGYFLPPAFYGSGQGTRGLFCADFNSDRDIDIAVVALNAATMTVFANNGTGVFVVDSTYSIAAPTAVYGGDFNRDNFIDLAVADSAPPGNILIFSGLGNNKFRYEGPVFVGLIPRAIYSNDYNNDGRLDLAVVAGRQVRIYGGLGNGQFIFLGQTNIPTNGRNVSGGDFDRDGHMDICLIQYDGGTYRATVLLGKGDGTFTPPRDYNPGSLPMGLCVGEFDADSLLDFSVVNHTVDSVSVFRARRDTIGTHAMFFRRYNGRFPRAIVTGDFDGDNRLDLVSGDFGTDEAALLVGNGDATFQPPRDFTAGDGPAAAASADLDGDGDIDLVIGDGNQNSIAVLKNFRDLIPPGPPQNLVANGANPSPWTKTPTYGLVWQNPPDSSGILRAFYKVGAPPNSNYDTTRTLQGSPPDTVRTSSYTSQMLYLWLKDGADNINYQNNASVNLRCDTIRPSGSNTSSPRYSNTLAFNVNWTRGSDAGGAGVKSWDVKYKLGNGAWQDWLTGHADTTEQFLASVEGTLYFEGGARDSADNVERFNSAPECSTRVDTTKPQVLSTNPADGDTGIAPNTNIAVYFSEPMDSSSFDTTKFSLFGSRSGRHSLTFSYNSSAYQVTLDPLTDFASLETVYVAAYQSVRDLAGNFMAADQAWRFRTGQFVDTIPPRTYNSGAFPSPTEPIANLRIDAEVSDFGRGNSNITGAQFFIDDTLAAPYQLQPVRPPFDSAYEAVWSVLDIAPLGWQPATSHKFFVKGRDVSRWGAFDTFRLSVIADNDTVPPVFSAFTPDTVADTALCYISCRISDPSGVYDDTTGSRGQGVYLIWDNDGEVSQDSFEVQMDTLAGGVYRTISPIPRQNPGVPVVYKVYAWDNDTVPGRHPLDRKKGTSGLRSVAIIDVRGPRTLSCVATPNPTQGETLLFLQATITDSSLGNSRIDTAQYYTDGGNKRNMKPLDGAYDEAIEIVYDSLNIKSWIPGQSHWLSVRGRDSYKRWGPFDSVKVVVTASPDTVPPRIVATSPARGDTGVILNSNVTITFSERMDTSSLNSTSLSVRGHVNGYYTFGTSFNSSHTAVTLDPDTLFASLETVLVTVSDFVRDSAGNSMRKPDSFSFVTGARIDNQGPRVRSVTASPNPSQGARYVLFRGLVSDSATGMTPIMTCECFIDSTGPPNSGRSMFAVDSIYDEVEESVYVRLWVNDSLSQGAHRFYLHAKDRANNWGPFDSLVFSVTQDDDTLGPIFYSFRPDSVPETAAFYVYARVTDPSGVYDDSTGSGGQGVYLVWNSSKFAAAGGFEVQMSPAPPPDSNYRTDEPLPPQTILGNVTYRVFAHDNDFDFGETWDRTRDSSTLRSIVIYDAKGPATTQTTISPTNPPQGTRYLTVRSFVSDSTRGMSRVSGAALLVDSTSGISRSMRAVDGQFDEIAEQVIDSFDISGWVARDTHTIYVRGRDTLRNWGPFDSVAVFVTERIDSLPPTVSFTRPARGDTGVPLNIALTATFSEKIDRRTLTRDKIWVEGARSGSHDFWWIYQENDTTLTVRCYVNFAQRESAWVVISPGIKDLKGNEDRNGYWWHFKTGDAPDTVGPVVTNTRIMPDTIRREAWARLDCHLRDPGRVQMAECFIDRMGPPDSGRVLKGLFGAVDVDAYDDSLPVSGLGNGRHTVYVHGRDYASNWGAYDSAVFMVDTSSLHINVTVDPSPVPLGRNVEIRAVPSMRLVTAPACTVTTARQNRQAVIMNCDTSGVWRGIYSTVGKDAGTASVAVLGTNMFLETARAETSLAITAAGDFLPEDSIHVFPNPAPNAKYPNRIFFRFFVNQNANVTVEVFTLTGKKMMELNRGAEGGRNNNIPTYIRNFGSDVYIWRIVAQSKEDMALKIESKFRKFAIAK